ncbi:Putative SOS response-associated peptidase YedK [Reichenbachiella agariperforans]|uniref:Abasic site processing protein n=1 Tax=Reichenbachiella agariperforans TaxID=156994 RepID=A0A1M6N6Q6_REIAG|nr:SOS response-associated peptidase [Reichenbachiella agariperforans]SHJ91399.1 Putative SOS response-associated peptidase YedK [Reichenbachiella agariperforans]
MIDRYAIFSDFKDINQRYGLEGEEFTVPNYNASPAQQLPIIANKSKKGISFFFWGTNKQWSNNKSISPKLLSAERDKLTKSTTLKTALMDRRCVIPVNGFYLWKQYSKKRMTPHYFYATDEELISLPGIWEEYEDMDGKINYTFKFIEVPNYSGVTEFGDNMPAVLSKDMEKKWLDDYSSPDELMDMLTNIPKLTNHPVSPHITSLTNNSADLIKPQAQVDQLGNYTLFE